MALSSFSDLKASISSWMFDRSDLAVIAEDCIALCEGDLNRVLRTRNQLTTVALTPDSEGKVTLPDDYLEFRQVTALTNPRRALQLVAPSYRDTAYPDRAADFPRVFTVDGDTMIVLPLTGSDIELEYFAKIAPLSDTQTTNWLLAKFPNIYLYGSLKHACVFIGDERMQTMGALFNGQLEGLINDEKMAMYARMRAHSNEPTP